jgi:hypothetical protein
MFLEPVVTDLREVVLRQDDAGGAGRGTRNASNTMPISTLAMA